MGIFKTLALRIALNREQRLVIWNALQYSDRKYRRRNDIDRALGTSAVIKQLNKAFGIKSRNYTSEEVDLLLHAYADREKEEIKKSITKAYEKGIREGVGRVVSAMKHGKGLKIGEIVVVEETPEESKETAEEEATTAPESKETDTEEETSSEEEDKNEIKD